MYLVELSFLLELNHLTKSKNKEPKLQNNIEREVR